MTRFHIHPVTGTPAECKAQQRNCPFDGEDEHYSSKAEARDAFEERMANSNALRSLNKKPKSTEASLELIATLENGTQNPDVLAFLAQAREDFSGATSPIALYRLDAVYDSVASDSSVDDPDIREAARILKRASRLTGNLLKTEGRLANFKEHSAHSKDAVRHAKVIEKALDEELAKQEKVYRELSRIKLNRAILDDPKPGDVLETSGHRSTIVRPEDAPAGSNVFHGRARSAYREASLEQIEELSADFVSGLLRSSGGYVPPAEGDEYTGPGGFDYLASGAESNVYLHEESGMVFKVPHSGNEFESIREDAINEGIEPTASFVAHVEEKYSQIDHKKLDSEYDAEYVPTYFLSTPTPNGDSVGVIVQPYLSGELYVPYAPSEEVSMKTGGIYRAGVSDVHAGNVLVNKKTRRLVLFDCLYAY